MKYSNSDIIEYYRNNNYADKNFKIIQFDTCEINFINYLLDRFAYNGNPFLDSNIPISISLRIDCIDAINRYMSYFRNFLDYPVGYFKKGKEDIDKDLLDDFLRLNSEIMLIDINTIFNGNYIWHEENLIGNPTKYHGLFFFSRVGFNKDKTKAMIVLQSTWDPICGSGDILVFEKISNGWEIINGMFLWVS